MDILYGVVTREEVLALCVKEMNIFFQVNLSTRLKLFIHSEAVRVRMPFPGGGASTARSVLLSLTLALRSVLQNAKSGNALSFQFDK